MGIFTVHRESVFIMSYIHKALRKAQRDKDSQRQGYDGVLSAQRGTNRFSGKAIFLISLVMVAGLLTFAFYSWFDSKDNADTDKIVSVSKDPVRAPVRKKTLQPTAVSKKPGTRPDRIKSSAHINVKQLYYRARAFQKSGRLRDAKQLYRKALKADPNYVDALNNLGVIYIQEKNYKEAQTNFERAIRFKPGNVDPYYNLACIYALRGEITLGIAHLKKACALDRSAKKWAQTDVDLQNLKGSPEFEKIIK